MAGWCTFYPDIEQLRDANLSVFSVDQLVSCKSRSSGSLQEVVEAHMSKRVKLSVAEDSGGGSGDQHKGSHIMVERHRRKQMTEHLSVLRKLTPCFYVKRGDQASIIGGVVDYITELQRVLQTLEVKKRRKVYSNLFTSHGAVSSPQKPQLSPRTSVPISPGTPQPTSPYRPLYAPLIAPSLDTCCNELVANSRSAFAEVEVKFSGGNLLLKTCSSRKPGQTTKLIAVLENLSLEVVHVDISFIDETLVNSFTIKIGVECRLSAEELAQHIQQTFC